VIDPTAICKFRFSGILLNGVDIKGEEKYSELKKKWNSMLKKMVD
jgi:hypothetical protein